MIKLDKELSKVFAERDISMEDILKVDHKNGEMLIFDGENIGFRSKADIVKGSPFSTILCDRYNLMFASLGNGTTVCNRMREEDGDYKTVAHIKEDGTVTFCEDKLPIPVEDAIRKMAR